MFSLESRDDSEAEEQKQVDRLEEISEYCPQLTFQQRLIGFAVSFSLGCKCIHIVLVFQFREKKLPSSCSVPMPSNPLTLNASCTDMIAFFSFRFFIDLVEGNPIPFAVNYTMGHILQLLASTFLCGPKRQFKNMFDDKRRPTTTIYLGCLASTLVVIFIPLPGLLKLLVLLMLMITQFCASTWYSLSYVPFGRRTALRVLRNIIGIEESNSSSTSYSNIFGGSQEIA